MGSTEPKTCFICTSEVLVLRKNPSICLKHNAVSGEWDIQQQHWHRSQACHECWEAYLSGEVDDRAPYGLKIECMFCDGVLLEEEWRPLAREGTRARFEELRSRHSRYLCQARCRGPVPVSDVHRSAQPHDRETDGRVFTCRDCQFQSCVDCDAPEHAGESCDEYKARMRAAHGTEEDATAANFKQCPECKTCFELEKGCGYTVCDACKHRFCSRCLIPWVGDGSAYLLGKSGHGENCTYRTRDAPSAHALKRRFEEDEEAIERKKRAKQAKLKKKSAESCLKKEEGVTGPETGDAKDCVMKDGEQVVGVQKEDVREDDDAGPTEQNPATQVKTEDVKNHK